MGLFDRKSKKPGYQNAIDDATSNRSNFWNSTPSSAKGAKITLKKRAGGAVARARQIRRRHL